MKNAGFADGFWAMVPIGPGVLSEPDVAVPEYMAARFGLAGRREAPKPYGMAAGGVATISVSGAIWTASSWWGTSYADIVAAAQAADGDPEVTSIMLVINSPGGAVAGLEGAGDAIAALSKPVRAHITGLCCSAAQLLSRTAEHTTIESSALAGGLGAILTISRYQPPEQDGHKMELRIVSRATPRKDWMQALDNTEASAQVTDDMQAAMDDIHESLIAAAGRWRSDDMKADGRAVVGIKAVEAGFADAVATFAGAMGAIQEEDTMNDEQMAAALAEATTAERDRIGAISALSGDAAVKEKAIAEGWDAGRAAIALNETATAAAAARTEADAERRPLRHWRRGRATKPAPPALRRARRVPGTKRTRRGGWRRKP